MVKSLTREHEKSVNLPADPAPNLFLRFRIRENASPETAPNV